MAKYDKKWFSKLIQSVNPFAFVTAPAQLNPTSDTHTAAWENNTLGITRCVDPGVKTWNQESDFTNLSNELIYDSYGGQVVNFHAGCWGGLTEGVETWNSTRHPDTSGETINGWTFLNSGGATTSITFEDGQLKPTFKAENDAAKTASYWRPTDGTLTQSDYFVFGINFKRTAISGDMCLLCGLFASETYNINSVFFSFDVNGKPYLFAYDDAGNEYSAVGTNGDMSENTLYWARLYYDVGGLYLWIYSDEETYNNWDTPYKELYIDLASVITGDLSLTKYGWHNVAITGAARSETWKIVKTDGYPCQFWATGTLRTVDLTSTELITIDYSRFYPDVNDEEYVTFKRRRQLTSGGSWTVDADFVTATDIRAMTDESLYGFGFEISMYGGPWSSYVYSLSMYFYRDALTKTWTNSADFSNAEPEVRINNALQTYHRGCWNGETWDSTHFPSLTGQWLQYWRVGIWYGSTSTIEFDTGKLKLTFKSEASNTKVASELIQVNSANSPILKGSSHESGIQYKRTAYTTTGGICWGFFSSTSYSYKVNSIHFFVDGAGKPYLRIYDSTGVLTVASGSNGDLSENTEYWPKLKADGTNIVLNVYPSQADYDANTNSIRTLTIAVASISGVVSCDFFGWNNYNEATVTSSSTWLITKTTSNVCNMYGIGYARCTETTLYGGVFEVNYASFAATITGTAKFRRRRKTTVTGLYVADNFYLTVAEIQALGTETLYGIGFDVRLEATTTISSADEISISLVGIPVERAHVTFKDSTDVYYTRLGDSPSGSMLVDPEGYLLLPDGSRLLID